MENLGKLNRVTIKGYKSFKNVDITIKDKNILIGAN